MHDPFEESLRDLLKLRLPSRTTTRVWDGC